MSTADTFIRRCARCSTPYDWRRSGSRSLRMTYCGSLCECADLGATIEALIALTRAAVHVEVRKPAEVPDSKLPYQRQSRYAQQCPRCGGDMFLDDDAADACMQCGARIVAAESYPPR